MIETTDIKAAIEAFIGPCPPGWVLGHNNIARAVNTRHGQRGFLCFWIQADRKNWELCDCGWRPELGPHDGHFMTTEACEEESMFSAPLDPDATLDLSIANGDLRIRADQLLTIRDAELKKWRISRVDLHLRMAEGAALMRGRDPATVRACAHENWDMNGRLFSSTMPRPSQRRWLSVGR
jgi:hypothetical protein